MNHGHVSYPLTPQRLDTPVRVLYRCERCGCIRQSRMAPRAAGFDPYSLICSGCLIKMVSTQPFFAEYVQSLIRWGMKW